ncbi:hypothetical protein HGRIS_014016 [Hohenbuehelia grisea]|uniref:Uncharacterized protein n=1 Tax=Hohenbuehelia grisea TaxID=104357 RepID=A0ABR3JS47_9AGAR
MRICENIIVVWNGHHEYLHLKPLIRFRTSSDYYLQLDSANFTCKAGSAWAIGDQRCVLIHFHLNFDYTIASSCPGIRIHEHPAHSPVFKYRQLLLCALRTPRAYSTQTIAGRSMYRIFPGICRSLSRFYHSQLHISAQRSEANPVPFTSPTFFFQLSYVELAFPPPTPPRGASKVLRA